MAIFGRASPHKTTAQLSACDEKGPLVPPGGPFYPPPRCALAIVAYGVELWMCEPHRVYFGVTSRAKWLATTSRMSLRFRAASKAASRDP